MTGCYLQAWLSKLDLQAWFLGLLQKAKKRYCNQRNPKILVQCTLKLLLLTVLWNFSETITASVWQQIAETGMKTDCNLKTLGLSFSLVSWQNHQKLIMVCSSFERIIWFLSVNVLGTFRLREKVYEIFFRTFNWKPHLKITVTEPF